MVDIVKCIRCKRFYDATQWKAQRAVGFCFACTAEFNAERDMDSMVEKSLNQVYLRHTFVDGSGI